MKTAAKKVQSDLAVKVKVDHDTKREPGSPGIVDTIFRKIEISQIFVCDITIVNKVQSRFWSFLFEKRKVRNTPNPNVLIELGYAIRVLGWERIICINHSGYSSPEELPFDIRKNRISPYGKKSKGKLQSKEALTASLRNAIKTILKDYSNISERHESNRLVGMDYVLYKSFLKICDEEHLKNSLEFAANHLRNEL